MAKNSRKAAIVSTNRTAANNHGAPQPTSHISTGTPIAAVTIRKLRLASIGPCRQLHRLARLLVGAAEASAAALIMRAGPARYSVSRKSGHKVGVTYSSLYAICHR